MVALASLEEDCYPNFYKGTRLDAIYSYRFVLRAVDDPHFLASLITIPIIWNYIGDLQAYHGLQPAIMFIVHQGLNEWDEAKKSFEQVQKCGRFSLWCNGRKISTPGTISKLWIKRSLNI